MTAKHVRDIRVYIYTAGDEAEYCARRHELCLQHGIDAKTERAMMRVECLLVWACNLLNVDEVDALASEIGKIVYGCNLVEIVIDDLSHSIGGADPNDPVVAKRLVASIRRLRKPFVNSTAALVVDQRDADGAPRTIIYQHRLTWDRATSTWRFVSRPSRKRTVMTSP